MSKRLRRVLFALIILPLIVFVVGCPKKPPPEPTQTTPPAASGTTPGEEIKEQPFEQSPGGEESSLDAMSDEIRRLNEQKPLGTVYFDLDKSDLRNDALEVLRRNAEWLKSHAIYRVRIEGNCDERGTTEYNLALGDRRASSVQSYLVKAGVDAGRFETISYGEEHPVDMGHDESAWQKNRRADFTITGKTSR
jgi:peptidoglycan-associated lipoprotein